MSDQKATAKKGVLLINLGTPRSCEPKSVWRYLRQFLNDPRVIDLPWLLRWVLVNALILPLRYRKSARAYQQIWLETGSPLLVNSQQLQQALATVLAPDYQVVLGMRYGQPSIKTALAALKQCEELTVLPLFPQYSSAASGSAIEKSLSLISKQWNIPTLKIKHSFYDDAGFIAAYAEVIKKALGQQPIELVLFSYHGLPERHINKSACQAECDRVNACPAMSASNYYCYRAQCYATTKLLAQAIGLTASQYQVCFQSRLGRTPWIKPYTDLLLPELIQKGVKTIAIVCPAFVADCLETLEEVNIRARAQWLGLGGKEFVFIPCLNASPLWVEALVNLVKI